MRYFHTLNESDIPILIIIIFIFMFIFTQMFMDVMRLSNYILHTFNY